MKKLCLIFAALTMFFPVSGREILDYVPANAECVLYGNSQLFFLSKVWKILRKNKDFQSEIVPKLTFVIPFKELSEFSGKVVAWSCDLSSKTVPTGAVIIFDSGIAQKVFDRIRNIFQLEGVKGNIWSGRKNGCPAFEASVGRDCKLAMVLVSNKEIHIALDNGLSIWKAVKKDNALVAAIDPACAAAITVSGESVKKILPRDEVGFEISKDVLVKMEAYIGQKKIRFNTTIDISGIE